MDEIVFLEPNDLNEIPFTTSRVISEHGQVRHDTVQRLIRNYEDDLKEFGKLGFEIRPLESGQSEKVYKLNEEQSTLLITYMKNTIPVRKFKKELVRQFFLMQKELISRKVTRQIGKQAREALTNAIQGLPESPHKDMKYKHYTDLVYKIVFGKNTKELKEQYGLSKKSKDLRNRFTSLELEQVEKLEGQISSLIDLDYDYKTIKDILLKKYLKSA
ncbi:MAG: Rha family transcriptional regulator [Desulfitobacterium hafniense]|nr:Rha family transcriptional regulator [Desulfitobacterium hafniense]